MNTCSKLSDAIYTDVVRNGLMTAANRNTKSRRKVRRLMRTASRIFHRLGDPEMGRKWHRKACRFY